MKHYELKATDHIFNVEEFESAWELARVNQEREVTPQWRGRSLKEEKIDESWSGVASREEAYNLLRNGWDKHIDRMNATISNAAVATVPKKASFRNDVEGFAPVVPLAMMNVPNSMLNTALKAKKSKVVKIIYSGGDSCGTSAEKFIKRGEDFLKSVISLERSGYRCEIYLADFFSEDERSDVVFIKIKEANQPLDVKRVMFPLLHTAMFRVVGFDWQDRCPSAKHIWGRGKPIHRVRNHEQIIKEAFGNWIYIDCEVVDRGQEAIEKRLKGEG